MFPKYLKIFILFKYEFTFTQLVNKFANLALLATVFYYRGKWKLTWSVSNMLLAPRASFSLLVYTCTCDFCIKCSREDGVEILVVYKPKKVSKRIRYSH